MRADGKKGRTADEISQQYLGEIAPLLSAARNVESLSPERKRQVRKRILRTAFGARSLRFRLRLTPVLVGLGLLVAGGVAFATAERLGLIRYLDQGPTRPSVKTETGDVHRRRGARSHLPGQPTPTESTVEMPAAPVVPQEAQDPVPVAVVAPVGVAPSVTPAKVATALQARDAEIPRNRLERRAEVPVAKSHREPAKTLAMNTPYLAESHALPSPQPPIGSRETSPSASVEPPSMVVPVLQAAPVATAPSVVRETAPPAVAPPAPRPTVSDSVLFGQALRKLRNEKDPAAALTALDEHARSFPRSALSGERGALQVEALLALHRDHEALERLDGMSLDELPRSGERFVVRGELRAAAHRWVDAKADFEHALTRVSGSPAWHERALWGRGVARLRCGEQAAGMEDIQRYRDLYPKGRFAVEASRFFSGR
jgi:hypothetical protein